MSGESAGNAYRKIFQMSMNAGKVADANKGRSKGTGIALRFSDGKGEPKLASITCSLSWQR